MADSKDDDLEKKDRKKKKDSNRKKKKDYYDKFDCYDHNDNKIYTTYLESLTVPKTKIDEVKDYYDLFVDMLKREPKNLHTQEHLWVLGIDKDDYSACLYIVTLGYPNFFTVESARLFKTALNKNSVKIIIGQSKPHTDILEVTQTDLELTNLIYYKAKILELELVDHVVISNSSIRSKKPLYCSHLEQGAMYFVQNDRTYKPYKEVKPELDKERDEFGAECEHNKAAEIAKKMLLKKKPIEEIIEFTGLSQNEIEELM